MDQIHSELKKMHLESAHCALLYRKEETILYKVYGERISGILKYYLTEDAKREIENYRLLAQLHIPTPQLFAATDSAILMEDLSAHPVYRLGTEEDVSAPAVAEKIAIWYRCLHDQSRSHPILQERSLYEEAALFTRDNLIQIQQNTATAQLSIWNLLEKYFDEILTAYRRVPKVLNYNDFYYTNLAVAKDHSSALMFDYHLLGQGYAYADVRNVISSMSPTAGAAFLATYGSTSPLEAALDQVLSHLITLYLACQRKNFPAWAQASLDFLHHGLEDALHKFLCLK